MIAIRVRNAFLALLALTFWGCGGGSCEEPNPYYDASDPTSTPCLDVEERGINGLSAESGLGEESAVNSTEWNEGGATEWNEGGVTDWDEEGSGGENAASGERNLISKVVMESTGPYGDLRIPVQFQSHGFAIIEDNPAIYYVFPDGNVLELTETQWLHQVHPFTLNPYIATTRWFPDNDLSLTAEPCNNGSYVDCTEVGMVFLHGEMIGVY